jgi:hypothetical protein
MNGSLHFQVYEHNLRRILLLDWIRDEHIRRRAARFAQQNGAELRECDKPYWLAQSESRARAAG